MKSIEEERDALLKGLQTVERAEQWYKDQLSSVQVILLKSNDKWVAFH